MLSLADWFGSGLMPSQYRLYPNMAQTTTLSSPHPGLGQSLNHHVDHSLHAAAENDTYISTEGRSGLPISTSNGSLFDVNIDASDFMSMNVKSHFPWDDDKSAQQCAHLYYPVRCSFQSSSSTINGSYCSIKTPLLPNTDLGIAEAQKSKQSILIPDYPQNLAAHHIKATKSRPADLRTSSGDLAIHPRAMTRSSPSYKRSITPSQLDRLAGALGIKSGGRTHAPQRSFESSDCQDRPTTPSLSFISTAASSSASSIMSPQSESEDIPGGIPLRTACAAALNIRNAKSKSDSRSCGRDSVESRRKQVQRKISGPLPNAEYPSTMNLTISQFSSNFYNSEEAFRPHRKIPKPPASIPLLPSPETPITPAEPPSWFDLDDDTSGKPSKHLNLPTKLSMPQLRLRAEPSPKTAPVSASTSKRGSEDSVNIAANIAETTPGVGKYASEPSAHISFSSSTPSLVHIRPLQATLKKKPSVRSRLLVPVSSESKKEKPKKAKVRSSTMTKKRSSERRLRVWFRGVFC